MNGRNSSIVYGFVLFRAICCDYGVHGGYRGFMGVKGLKGLKGRRVECEDF